MSKWPIGVFASVDAGLGVNFDVVRELSIPSIQLHAPHQGTRNKEAAEAFLEKCTDAGVTITCVFGGFEGESYADIETTARTVGLVPKESRAARVQEMKEISDFARLLGVGVVGLHIGFVPEDTASDSYQNLLTTTRDLRTSAHTGIRSLLRISVPGSRSQLLPVLPAQQQWCDRTE